MTLRDQLNGTVKDLTKTGGKKTAIRFTIGSEQSKNGEWVHKERLIDQTTDTYFERITNEHGTTKHHCSERLTEHRGHGSAKFKNN